MPPKVVLSSDDVVDVSNDEPTDDAPSVIGEMRKPPDLGRLARVVFPPSGYCVWPASEKHPLTDIIRESNVNVAVELNPV